MRSIDSEFYTSAQIHRIRRRAVFTRLIAIILFALSGFTFYWAITSLKVNMYDQAMLACLGFYAFHSFLVADHCAQANFASCLNSGLAFVLTMDILKMTPWSRKSGIAITNDMKIFGTMPPWTLTTAIFVLCVLDAAMTSVTFDKPNDEMFETLRKVQEVVLHTGNVLEPGRIDHRSSLAPIDETIDSLKSAFAYYAQASDQDCDHTKFRYTNDCMFLDWCQCSNPFESDERPYLKITQKVFLYNLDGSLISDAVHNLITYFKTDKIDNLILCLPAGMVDNITPENGKLTALLNLWKHVEALIDEKVVVSAGLTYIPWAVFEDLYQNCGTNKPTLLQLDVAICCQIPDDVRKFTSRNDIKMLVTREPNEMFSDADLNSMIATYFPEGQAAHSGDWNLKWLMRYTVLCERHSVIRNKGYAIKAINHSH